MRRSTLFCLRLALASLASLAGPANASVFVEEFTSTAFLDTTNTTADWNTGQGVLTLFPVSGMAPISTFGAGSDVIGARVWGDYAYLCDGGPFGTDIRVVDLSVPSTPVLAGLLNTDNPRDLTLIGNRAYVADGTAGLKIFDIASPVAATLLGSIALGSSAEQVQVRGDLAFVAGDTTGLRIVDVSNPSVPSLVGQWSPTNAVLSLAIEGEHAYVVDSGVGLVAVDISNPALPTMISSLSIASAQRVVVDGDQAFVASLTAGVVAVDISSPNAMTISGSLSTGGLAKDLAVDGDYLYVTDSASGLVAVDITALPSMSTIQSFVTAGTTERVDLDGNRAVVSDGVGGLQIVRIAVTPMALRPIGPDVFIFGFVNDAIVAGNHAFLAEQSTNTFDIISLSDPGQPMLSGSYSATGLAWGIDAEGNFAYSGKGSFGFEIVDVSTPDLPTFVGSVASGAGFVRGVDVDGNRLYVANDVVGLQIFDVSNRALPLLLGTFNSPGIAYHVSAQGDLAYLADGSSLQIVDVSDPTAPSVVGAWTGITATKVTVCGDVAYVVGGSAGVSVVNVSNPSAPLLLTTIPTGHWARDVEIAGDILYVAESNAGLNLYDVSNPSLPTLIGTSDFSPSSVSVNSVNLFGDYVVSGLTNGFSSSMNLVRVRERALDHARNTARSLEVDGQNFTILRARVTTVPAVNFAVELSADGGVNWQSFTPGAPLQAITNPGTQLLWRGTLGGATAASNAVLDRLEIEFQTEVPSILSILDIPADEGRQVRVSWQASGNDRSGAASPIFDYAIYRRVDPLPKTATAVTDGFRLQGDPGDYSLESLQAATPVGSWDFLALVPASAAPEYSFVAPTLADSTIAAGQHLSAFFVRALTNTSSLHFDSAVSQGYSVDNLPPSAPGGFIVSAGAPSGLQLDWQSSPNPDFDFFRIYRGTTAGFVPGPINLVHTTTAIQWLDVTPAGPGVTYKISAVDFSGNEGEYSIDVHPTSGPPSLGRVILRQNTPNPFNPSTTIRFVLDRSSTVKLDIFDTTGRHVVRLASSVFPSGTHSLRWDGTDGGHQSVGSGTYFYRLDVDGKVLTRKAVLIK